MKEKRVIITIFDADKRLKRQYLLLPNCDDIENKILNHTLNFIKCSVLCEDEKHRLSEQLITLCHKINLVEYHKRRYKFVENRLQKKYERDLRKGKMEGGIILVEDSQLTAELEAFLLQFKSALDILVGFLNIIHRKNEKHPLKKQVTFENKGQNVIKDLEKYLSYHPEKRIYLEELLNNLKRECIASEKFDDGSLNWLLTVINERDYIAHFNKAKYFAFQINNLKDRKTIIPPLLTRKQYMFDALEVFYDNLLIFIQDFVALLLKPYLNEFFSCFTYDPKEMKPDSPKWYIVPTAFANIGFGLNVQNPMEILKFLKVDKKAPLGENEFSEMFMYYWSFYMKNRGYKVYKIPLKNIR